MEPGADPKPEAAGLRALQVLPPRCLPGVAELLFAREAGGKSSLHRQLPECGLGLNPSHGLGISVSLADEHLQEP